MGLWLRLCLVISVATYIGTCSEQGPPVSGCGQIDTLESDAVGSFLQTQAFVQSLDQVPEKSVSPSSHSLEQHAQSTLALMYPVGSSKHYAFWWLGIIACVLGCLSSAIGLLLMKQSGMVEADLPLHQRWRWAVGVLFLVVNASVIDMIAFSLTPLALMAPFSGVTIVFSSLLAYSGCLGIKEDATFWQWVSIAIVCIGVAMISVYGPRTSQELTESTIQAHLFSVQFKVFAAFCVIAIGYSMLLWRFKEQPATFSVVAFAIGSSASGAVTQMSLKVLSNSLRDYFNGTHALVDLPTCIGVLGLIIFAPPQLLLLNSALVNSPLAFAVPLYQTLLILSTVAAGGIFFDEFASISADWLSAFFCGIMVAITGLLALGSSSSNSSKLPNSPA